MRNSLVGAGGGSIGFGAAGGASVGIAGAASLFSNIAAASGAVGFISCGEAMRSKAADGAAAGWDEISIFSPEPIVIPPSDSLDISSGSRGSSGSM